MRIFDTLSICVRNLARRKVRTALTVVGVVIGVCAIILMISLGLGATASMESMLAQWGDLTLINVYNYNAKTKLDDEAVAKMQAIDGVDIATPFYQSSMQIQIKCRDGRYQIDYLQLYGVYPEALEKLGYTLSDGNFLKTGDKDYSLVMGANTAYNFRDTRRKRNNMVDRNSTDAAGNPKQPFVNLAKDKITLSLPLSKEGSKPLEFVANVQGIMKEDWSKGWETSECAFMDITELKALIQKYNKANGNTVKKNEKTTYNDVRVKCLDVDNVAKIQQQIKDMGYECSSMEDARKNIQDQLNRTQALLGGLAAISLLVAAIGIANTMVMSIYERTREIGVMKVIGAQVPDIRVMFLIESAFIGLIGGIVGVTLSFTISYLLNNVQWASALLSQVGLSFGMGGKVSIIPAWLVGAAMAFSMLIGVVFGFIPANRAVKISALEAIKHD